VISIAFTGDVGFSKYFKDTFKRDDLMTDEVVDFLADTDYTVINVEGAVTKATATAQKPLIHANDPGAIDWLLKLNGKVWNLANNHTMDCGEAGALDTLAHARANHCLTVGLGENIAKAEKSLLLYKEGIGVGLVSVTYSIPDKATEEHAGCILWNDNERIKKQIEEVKKKNRWCVVIAHAGVEFAQMPLPYIRKQYKKYLEYGADIVVGHHPHVVQNYEKLGDKIIFYSLGNFVFDTDYQRRQKYTDTGMLIKLRFTESDYSWEYKPIKINRTTQTIEVCECPAIFCNISKLNYALLWPYAAKDFRRNRRKVYTYHVPERVNWTEKQWRKFEVGKCTEKAETELEKSQQKQIIVALTGSFLSRLNFWRLSKKSLIEYLE